MLLRDEVVTSTTEHKYGCRRRDKWNFGCRIPFLMAQEGKRAENRKCVWYQTGKGRKRIFEYQRIDLSSISTQKTRSETFKYDLGSISTREVNCDSTSD